jgi:hypothetical protein
MDVATRFQPRARAQTYLERETNAGSNDASEDCMMLTPFAALACLVANSHQRSPASPDASFSEPSLTPTTPTTMSSESPLSQLQPHDVVPA